MPENSHLTRPHCQRILEVNLLRLKTVRRGLRRHLVPVCQHRLLAVRFDLDNKHLYGHNTPTLDMGLVVWSYRDASVTPRERVIHSMHSATDFSSFVVPS